MKKLDYDDPAHLEMVTQYYLWCDQIAAEKTLKKLKEMVSNFVRWDVGFNDSITEEQAIQGLMGFLKKNLNNQHKEVSE